MKPQQGLENDSPLPQAGYPFEEFLPPKGTWMTDIEILSCKCTDSHLRNRIITYNTQWRSLRK